MKKILVADDSKMNRMILEGILEDEFEVTEASDGYEALRIMRAEPESFSAVLLDLEMPSMDGYEVMRTMKQSDALSRIPVVVCTASDELRTQEEAVACGAVGFIIKPYNSELIVNLLRNIADVFRPEKAKGGSGGSDEEIFQWMELISDMQTEKTSVCEFNLTKTFLCAAWASCLHSMTRRPTRTLTRISADGRMSLRSRTRLTD